MADSDRAYFPAHPRSSRRRIALPECAAHYAVTRRCGPVIGKRQLEESVVQAAADISAFYAARIPEPCTPGTLLILSADCKGVVMRPGALRAATVKAAERLGKMRIRLASGEKPNRKNGRLAAVYDAEPARRRPHDIIAPPGGRHGPRELRPGPEARGKWLAASVLRDSGEVIAAMFDEAEACDPGYQASGVIREITAEADAAGLAGSQRNGAAACVRYLDGKREYLRYDQALQAGWPVATGVIEGACRHIIGDRLSIGGARWGLDGAEAVLTLRAVISNGDFREYWRFHLAREHQRLYPGTAQGQYALSA